MNPYAKYVEGKDTITILSESSDKIKKVIENIGPDNYGRSYGEGKWDVTEILTHLMQTELNYAIRLRGVLTTKNYVVQPFNQDVWVDREAKLSVDDILPALRAVRNLNLALIQTLTEEDKTRALAHPEFGEFSVAGQLELMAGHDLSHLAQLETIAASVVRHGVSHA